MTQQLLPFPDRSREIYACDVVWGYFLLTGTLHQVFLYYLYDILNHIFIMFKLKILTKKAIKA